MQAADGVDPGIVSGTTGDAAGAHDALQFLPVAGRFADQMSVRRLEPGLTVSGRMPWRILAMRISSTTALVDERADRVSVANPFTFTLKNYFAEAERLPGA